MRAGPSRSSCLLWSGVVGHLLWQPPGAKAFPTGGGDSSPYWPSSSEPPDPYYYEPQHHQTPPPSYRYSRTGFPLYKHQAEDNDEEEEEEEGSRGASHKAARRSGGRLGKGQTVGRRRTARGQRHYPAGSLEGDDDFYYDGVDEGREEDGIPHRGDLVDQYWRGFRGRLLVTAGAGTVGALLGAALSASLMGQPDTMLLGGLLVGLFICQLNNDFAILFRALGLMLFLFIRRSILTLRLRSRRPFPPSDNPWNYRRVNPTDIDFDMPRSLLAVGLGGCFSGWSLGNMLGLFFFPPWILALAFGGFLAYTATLHDSRGDLARLLGMKVVALVSVLRALDCELMVTPKLGRVFNISAAGMSRFDRRYKVREKLGWLAMSVYSRFNGMADRVQDDMAQSPSGNPFAPSAPFAPSHDYEMPPEDQGAYSKRRPPPYNPEYQPR